MNNLQHFQRVKFVGSLRMDKLKSLYTRHSGWPGAKAYIWYVERLANHYNAGDGDFQRT